ncbi:hypothetical protein MMPV_004054 [Pyropia vietnamensis]
MYVGMTTSAMGAMRGVSSLLLYNTLRRTSILFVLGGEMLGGAAGGPAPRPLSLRALLAVTATARAGTAVATSAASTASTASVISAAGGAEWGAYALALTANATSAGYLLSLKRVRAATGLSSSDLVGFLTAAALPPLAAAAVASGEWAAARRWAASATGAGVAAAAASIALGGLINHATVVNTTTNSALAQAVGAQVKDGLLAAGATAAAYGLVRWREGSAGRDGEAGKKVHAA